MRRGWWLLIGLLAMPLVTSANREGPVPGRAGGFGGPTCHACHRDHALDEPGGELAVIGLPDRYTAGARYRITVELKRAGLERAGFQVAARVASGSRIFAQAGEWRTIDDRVTIHPDAARTVSYPQHSAAGTETTTRGGFAWSLDWIAPKTAVPVQFNVAATATNGDGSPLGDYVYLKEVTVLGR